MVPRQPLTDFYPPETPLFTKVKSPRNENVEMDVRVIRHDRTKFCIFMDGLDVPIKEK